MNKVKSFWCSQDWINRIILITGLLLAIACLAKGEGLYGVVVVVVMVGFCIAHQSSRIKRLSFLYGSLYFHAPDGEIVPMTFEQVKTEYIKGVGMKYMDRRLTVRFPYWRVNEIGRLDSGFGLCIDVSDFEDQEGILKNIKSGDFISVTGVLVPEGRDYFYLGKIEELRRISAKEAHMV